MERAGEAKAVIVPVREYQEIQRIKQEARERAWQAAQELQAAFKNVNPQEVEREIERTIQEVRAQKRKNPSA